MALDMSHHLSQEARKRPRNPMKVIWKLARSREGLITLANGDPHPSLYALSQVDFHIPKMSDNVVTDWRDKTASEHILSTSASEPAPLDLKIAMQYGRGIGSSELCEILQGLNVHIHGSIPNNSVTLHVGNADGVTKCFRLLGDPGDSFLAEEFSYPGVTHAPLAHGIRWIPVTVDKDGLVPEAMEKILSEWDEATYGRRPHVLYTIPCGQNPTGSTLSIERRKKIYSLAQKYDIIIMEDDPYYFLQYSEANHLTNGNTLSPDGGRSVYLQELLPSFLSLDVDGRVIRLDSFSKIIAPGMRLGWFTSSAFFNEHLEALTDSSVQHPHGMGQLYAAELLSPSPRGWGYDGLINWCEQLAKEYQRKRDLFLALLKEGFGDQWGTLVSVDVPVAGMFVCLYIAVERIGTAQTSEPVNVVKRDPRKVIDSLFHHLMDQGVVVMPAATFAIEDSRFACANDVFDRANFLRLTFAGTDEIIHKAVELLVAGIMSFTYTA